MRHPLRFLMATFLAPCMLLANPLDTSSVSLLKSGKLGGNLAAIDFPTPSIGYAAGNDISISANNFIAKSTDGGLTWQRLSTPALSDRPQAVRFLNADTGFVAGYTGMLLRTTNGGSNWVSVNSSGYTGTFNDVRFINNQTGFACGSYVTANGTAVIKTTDGGLTWSFAPVGGTNSRYSILSLSTNEILIAGTSGNIARTTDGGTTWGSVTSGPSTLQSLARVGSNGVVVCGAQRILYKSTDRGASFTPILATGGAGLTLYGISMADSLNGFAVGSNGLNYRTRNGWASVDSILISAFTAQVCRCVVARSATEILVGADQGNMLRSTDFGNSWTTIESSTRYYALDFINRNTGVAVGWRGTILKTTTGGTSGTEIRGANGFELYDVQMFDANTFYACGGNGRFYVTTNGGASFVERSLPVLNAGSAKTMYFFNPTHGYCSGEMGRIYYTTNAGVTWDSLAYLGASFNNIEDITFVGDSVGFAVGERGQILKTTNRINWDTIGITRPAILTLWEAKFLNSSFGYVASQNGTIFRTTNGGAAWTQVNDTTGLGGIDVIDIDVLSPTGPGYAVAEQGKLLRMISPTSWRTDRTITTVYGTPDNLWGLDFVSSDSAFVSGYYGTLYLLRVMPTVDVAPTESPSAFALMQNYPNPFNPTTKIAYKLQRRELVTLKVFDLLGREVATLVNEQKDAGAHSTVWNGGNAASGVYFYRLQAGSFTDVKKLLLLK